MSFSANEIASLAQKAARGAGFPPAQADLFGRATVQHLTDGRPPEALTDALADVTNSPILRLPLLIEDILRVLPLAGPEITLTLQPGDEALIETYVRLLPVRLRSCTVLRDASGQLRLALNGTLRKPQRRPAPARIEAPQPLLDTLSRYAAQTYVPASEASRSAGAGAGNIDND